MPPMPQRWRSIWICIMPCISGILPAVGRLRATLRSMVSRRRVAKAVLISAVPPLMVKREGNPGGTPIEVFDGFRKALAANRSQFYLDVASGPFYGFNREGAEVSQGTIQNWWRQGMTGSAKAHYEGIKGVFGNRPDRRFKAITLPVLVMQGR